VEATAAASGPLAYCRANCHAMRRSFGLRRTKTAAPRAAAAINRFAVCRARSSFIYAPYAPPDVLVVPMLPVAPVLPVVLLPVVLPDVPAAAMLPTLERARSYASRPRSTIWLTFSVAC